MPEEALEKEDVRQHPFELTPDESQFDAVYAKARESGTFGDFATAAHEYEQAAFVARSFGESDARLFETLSRLAYCRYRLGDLSQAEASYLEALQLLERFHAQTHPERLASVLWALAVLLSDLLRYDEAEKYFRRSMDVSESWAGPSDRFVADCLWGLSKCLTSNGKLLEAETAIKRAVAIYETLPENCDEYLSTNYANLGALNLQRSNFEGAVDALVKAVTYRRKLAGEMDAGLISLSSKLALALMQLKRLKEAEKYLRLALKISTSTYGPKNIETARKYIALGNCLNGLGKYDQAEKMLSKAIVVVREQMADPALSAACLYELTTCYQKLNEKAKGKKALEELSDLYVQPNIKLPKHSLYADAQLKLGNIYEEACLFKKARICYQSALTARESVFGQEHKLVAECLMRIAGCMTKMSQHADAQELYRKAETMLADLKKRA